MTPPLTRIYPASPPACLQCSDPQHPISEDGWVGLPTNDTCIAWYTATGCTPAIPTFSHPFWIVLYFIWIFTLLFAAFWTLYRRHQRYQLFKLNKQQGQGQTRREEQESDLSKGVELVDIFMDDEDIVEEKTSSGDFQGRNKTPFTAAGYSGNTNNHHRFASGNDDYQGHAVTPSISQSDATATTNQERKNTNNSNGEEALDLRFFKRSWWGETMARFLLILNTFILFLYFLILCGDFYSECENLGTIDNFCWFGSFRLFGDFQGNSEAFFVIWCVAVVEMLVASAFWKVALDWIKLPSLSGDADFVSIGVQTREAVVTSGPPSAVTRTFRELYARIVPKWNIFKTASSSSGRRRYVTVPIYDNDSGGFGRGGGGKYFLYECARYSIPDGTRVPSSVAIGTTVRDVYDLAAKPLTESARLGRRAKVGTNTISLENQSLSIFLAEEFFTPFMAYQTAVYLVYVWFSYWIVGLILWFVVLGSGISSALLRRRATMAVHALADHRDGVSVFSFENKTWRAEPTALGLVPGDVVKIQGGGWTVPADIVLVEGSCAVDEADMTGESMPQPKSRAPTTRESLPAIVWPLEASPTIARSHALMAGTRVLEANPDTVGVVVATGIDATRGRLLSHVLFPVRTLFRFEEEFGIAIALLSTYAFCILIASIVLQSHNGSGSSWTTVFIFSAFCVAQVVSPMLRIALVAGRVASTHRLNKIGISVLDAHRIDVAGKVRLFCFDKTGTLTTDGLDLVNAQAVSPNFEPDLKRAMATCHSLGEFNGEVIGSSVERAMFLGASSSSQGEGGWTILPGTTDQIVSTTNDEHLFITRRMEFDQSRRTMSVVVAGGRNHQGDCVYVKGAPESVAQRCITPTDAMLRDAREKSATDGCYVLAVAMKRCSGGGARDAPRDELESGLELLGLLSFRNEPKPEAAGTIQALKQGHVRCVVVTGDNALTAAHVCRRIGLVQSDKSLLLGELTSQGDVEFRNSDDQNNSNNNRLTLLQLDPQSELALTGDAFDALREQPGGLPRQVLHRVRVFARVSPAQKVRVVRAFMSGKDGIVTGFAGDGGNDAGALRAAHVGLSVAGAEASVVAHCSSKDGRISSVLDLLTEGRCSLATSLASFKLLVTYGLMMSMVNIASFTYAVQMPLAGFILFDLIALVPMTFAVTLSHPLPYLGPHRPTSSLLGPVTVASLVGVEFVALISMLINLGMMGSDPGYVRWPTKYVFDFAAWWLLADNWESSVITESVFLVFVTSALTFSFGGGDRKPFWTNRAVLVVWASLFIFTSAVYCSPAPTWMSFQFHVASEQFNRNGTYSPIWQAYQNAGGAPSPAMSLSLRLGVWGISVGGLVFLALWERIVVMEFIAKGWLWRSYRTSFFGKNISVTDFFAYEKDLPADDEHNIEGVWEF